MGVVKVIDMEIEKDMQAGTINVLLCLAFTGITRRMENCFFEHVYGCKKKGSVLTTTVTTRIETIIRNSKEYRDEIHVEFSEMTT